MGTTGRQAGKDGTRGSSEGVRSGGYFSMVLWTTWVLCPPSRLRTSVMTYRHQHAANLTTEREGTGEQVRGSTGGAGPPLRAISTYPNPVLEDVHVGEDGAVGEGLQLQGFVLAVVEGEAGVLIPLGVGDFLQLPEVAVAHFLPVHLHARSRFQRPAIGRPSSKRMRLPL